MVPRSKFVVWPYLIGVYFVMRLSYSPLKYNTTENVLAKVVHNASKDSADFCLGKLVKDENEKSIDAARGRTIVGNLWSRDGTWNYKLQHQYSIT